MSLSQHLNADKVLTQSKEHASSHQRTHVPSLFEYEGGRSRTKEVDYETSSLPKFSIPSKGIDAEKAYSLVHNELELDGKPLLNLASFVHTHVDDWGTKLCMENINKNLIDSDEYEMTTLIHSRCISMIAKLWHADEQKKATGTATTGSSEAIQLAGLAMKKRWQEKRRAEGKDEYRPGPNIVMGANAQVALEKFARYFDVEARLVPVDESTKYVMSPERAMEYVDENTIGIFVILGSTYTGLYEDVAQMSKLLDAYQAKTGLDIPIHVDAASGGFVAPFATPKHLWDFRIPRVVSINASGHKYGKAYVGVGWVIWRDAAHLPKDLVFTLTYLGSVEQTFSLNFSRPAHPIICSYYLFLKNGFEGYRKIALHDAKNARLFARALENSKYYDVVSDIHKPATPSGVLDQASQAIQSAVGLSDDIESYVPSLPVVAFKFSQALKDKFPHAKQAKIQTLLRAKGWIIPNYALPPNVETVEILRVVVREQMSEDLIERLVTDIIHVTEDLIKESKGIKDDDDQNSSAHTSGEKEKHAANDHGAEGSKPTGHDSVC